MAKSIQSTIEKHIISDDKKRVLTASQTSDMASFGTPVLNLLSEFQAMQGEQQNGKQLEERKNEDQEECALNLENEVFSQMTQNQSENAQTQNVTQTSSTSHTSGTTFLLGNLHVENWIYKVPQQSDN